jgi:GAF domain-containing protein
VPTFLERLRGDPARVRLERLERLQGLTEELSAAQTRDEVLRVVFERGLGLVDASGVALYWERAPGELDLLHALGLSEDAVQGMRSVHADDPVPVAEVYRTGKPLWLPTPEEIDARYPGMNRASHGVAAAAALPVGSESRGILGLMFREPRAFDQEERSFILAIARQCTNAVERARLFDASSRLAERLRQALSAASVISTVTTSRDVTAAAFRALGTLGACAAEIHAAEGDERVALLARHGRAPQQRADPVVIDAPTPAAEVVRTGKAVWLESPEEIAQRYPTLEVLRAEREEGAWAVVPLLCSGRALGALAASFPDARRFPPDDRTFLRLVAQPCAQALERRRLVAEAVRARGEAEWTAALLSGLGGMDPVGVALLDRDMRFLRVNANFARLAGVAEAGCVGRTPVEVLPRVPEDKVKAAFGAVLETGITIERELEAVAPGTPGRLHRYTTTWFPVRVHDEVAGVGVLVRDHRG